MKRIEDLTVGDLVEMADCLYPDTSDGISFLRHVQDAVPCYDNPDEDVAWEIADQAIPSYTHQKWTAFIDLGGYQEDVDDYGPIESMDQGCNVALFQIALRLAQALLTKSQPDEEE